MPAPTDRRASTPHNTNTRWRVSGSTGRRHMYYAPKKNTKRKFSAIEKAMNELFLHGINVVDQPQGQGQGQVESRPSQVTCVVSPRKSALRWSAGRFSFLKPCLWRCDCRRARTSCHVVSCHAEQDGHQLQRGNVTRPQMSLSKTVTKMPCRSSLVWSGGEGQFFQLVIAHLESGLGKPSVKKRC